MHVDLQLRTGTENRPPTLDEVRRVEALGGRIIHRFHVALLRVDVDTAALYALTSGPGAIADAAFAVLDSTRVRFRGQVYFSQDATAADRAGLRALGLAALESPRPDLVTAFIPDSVTPTVAQMPGVRLVRVARIGCVGWS